MSHHGQDLPPIVEEMMELQDKISGKYPDGKMSEDDEGMLALSVSVEGKKVVLAFGKPTQWLGMTGGQAMALSKMLMEHAREVGILRE